MNDIATWEHYMIGKSPKGLNFSAFANGDLEEAVAKKTAAGYLVLRKGTLPRRMQRINAIRHLRTLGIADIRDRTLSIDWTPEELVQIQAAFPVDTPA